MSSTESHSCPPVTIHRPSDPPQDLWVPPIGYEPSKTGDNPPGPGHRRLHRHTTDNTNIIWSWCRRCGACPVHTKDQTTGREEARWRKRSQSGTCAMEESKQRNLYLERQAWSWFLPSTQMEFAGFSHGPVGVNTTSASASTERKKKSHPLIFIPRLEWEVLPCDIICFGRFRISWICFVYFWRVIYLVLIGYETIFMYWIWFACESLAMPWSLRSHIFPDGIYLGSMLDMRQFSCTGFGLLMSFSRCHGR